MKLEVRHISRTVLELKAFKELVKKYCKTDKKLLIVFDERIVDCGYYVYDSEKKMHIIRISPDNIYSIFDSKIEKAEKQVDKYCLISTTLHELKHLSQRDELGVSFWNKGNFSNKEIKDSQMSEQFSKCELEARAFESENVLEAVEYYNSFLKK